MAGNGKEDSLSYDSDPRLSCKYGQKCYQKNAVHHQKYKHPTKRSVEGLYCWCMGPRCKLNTRVALQSQYAIPCSTSLPTVQHAFYPFCTSGLTSPLFYPQCITHSIHTALSVYRYILCVISAHCAAVVCASSQNNGGRDFENYNAIRWTVAEVFLCSPIVIWKSDASGRRWTERDVLHGSLLWRAYGIGGYRVTSV